MYYTGTLNRNRKNIPAKVKYKMNHLEHKFFRSQAGILLAMWKDKKAKNPVIIVSCH